MFNPDGSEYTFDDFCDDMEMIEQEIQMEEQHFHGNLEEMEIEHYDY